MALYRRAQSPSLLLVWPGQKNTTIKRGIFLSIINITHQHRLALVRLPALKRLALEQGN